LTGNRCTPVAAIRHVDGKFGGICGNFDFRLGQHPAAQFAVKRKTGNTVADGEHEYGRRAIDGKSSRHLLRSGLQKCLFVGSDAFRAAQH
jgi:hypothetical protein